MNIGKNIKELRKKRGITQERLAEYLNVSTQAVSKWESKLAENGISKSEFIRNAMLEYVGNA